MKKIFIFFLAMILFLSCQSTPNAIEETPVAAPLAVGNLVLPEGVSIRDTERGKVLVANSKIIFMFASDALPRNAISYFNNVIKPILDSNPNLKVVLEAHTSNKGIAYPYNYALSQKRASLGKKHFNSAGISDERVISKAFGESLPEFPRQQYLRRYEFVLIENDEDLERYNNFFKTINVRTEMTYNIYTNQNAIKK